MTHNAFRDGKVHVCKTLCSTCVFRPGNLMHLKEGRVEEMIEQSIQNESAIICHKTLHIENSVCRGFFEKHKTSPLQVAERLNTICETEVD